MKFRLVATLLLAIAIGVLYMMSGAPENPFEPLRESAGRFMFSVQ